MEKVVLPKEVAEAVEDVWGEIPGKIGPVDSVKYGWLTNWRTLYEHFPEPYHILNDYFEKNPVDYVSALTYGYVVEEDMEKRLREHYEYFNPAEWENISDKQRASLRGRRFGILRTLNTLGIKVKGIND